MIYVKRVELTAIGRSEDFMSQMRVLSIYFNVPAFHFDSFFFK